MGWLLNNDALNNKVIIASESQVNIGTDSYFFEFAGIFENISAERCIYASSFQNFRNGIFIRTTNRLSLYTSGAARLTLTGWHPNDIAYHVYRFEHDANGDWRFKVDGTITLTGNFTTPSVMRCKDLYAWGNATNNEAPQSWQLRYFETGGAWTNPDKWDADLSSGSGIILPSVSGLNNGTLTNYAADPWVFYDAGGATAYDDTLSGAGYSASIGTLASARGFNDTLNGVTYSGAVGNMIATRGLSSELSGATYSAEIGSLSSLRGYSSLLSAADYGAAIGELISTLDGATAYSDLLSGISATVAIGDLASSVQRASILNGLAYGFSVGDFTSSAGYNSALSGVNYSSSIGQLTSTLSGEVTVTIEGYTIRFADSAVAAVYADDSISVIYAN